MALLRVETVRELFGDNVEQNKQSYLPVLGLVPQDFWPHLEGPFIPFLPKQQPYRIFTQIALNCSGFADFYRLFDV